MKNIDGTYVVCRDCGKICYSSREAGEIINSSKRHHRSDHLGRSKKYPRRKYFCSDCGYYHVTSMKAEYSEVSKSGNWDEHYYNFYLNRKIKKYA